MGKLGGVTGVEHRTQHVRDMGKRHELVRRRQHSLYRVKIDPAVRGQRGDVDCNAGAVPQQLPRNDVAVMLQRREQDAVACLEVVAPAVRDEIDRLGRAAHEHDLVWRGRVDEPGDAAPRSFERQRHIR
jgi:hypothetical protein